LSLSKRPQEKANENGGFDRLNHRSLPILKIDFRVFTVVELVVAELVEASKHRNARRKGLTIMVVSTGSTTKAVERSNLKTLYLDGF